MFGGLGCVSQQSSVAEEPGWNWDAVLGVGDVMTVTRSFRDMDFDTVASGFRDAKGGQDVRDAISLRSVESSRGRVERCFILGMSEFGSPPNAKRVTTT